MLNLIVRNSTNYYTYIYLVCLSREKVTRDNPHLSAPFEIPANSKGIRLSVNIVDSNLMSHGEIRSKEKRQFRKRISETRFFSSLVVAFEISRNSSAPPLRTGCTNFREPFPFAPRRVGKAAVQEFNIKLYIPRNFTGVVNNFNSNGGLRVRNKKYKKRRKTVTLHVCIK